MCCNNKVSFGIKNTSDVVTKENGVPLYTPLTIQGYVASKPIGTFWLENSRFGYTGICTNLTLGTDLVLTLLHGAINYEVEPEGFVGGHPIHRPPNS